MGSSGNFLQSVHLVNQIRSMNPFNDFGNDEQDAENDGEQKDDLLCVGRLDWG